MSDNNNNHSESRRKFIKAAVGAVYVAPLVASLPAHATYSKTGSAANCEDGEKTYSYKSSDSDTSYSYSSYDGGFRYRR